MCAVCANAHSHGLLGTGGELGTVSGEASTLSDPKMKLIYKENKAKMSMHTNSNRKPGGGNAEFLTGPSENHRPLLPPPGDCCLCTLLAATAPLLGCMALYNKDQNFQLFLPRLGLTLLHTCKGGTQTVKELLITTQPQFTCRPQIPTVQQVLAG